MASVLYFALFLSLGCVLWNGADAECNRIIRTCPSGWTQFGNRCFLFQNAQRDWASAERDCISLGANLASMHSDSEHVFLKNLVNSKTGSYAIAWIGGHDGEKEGVWLWTDGSKFDYSNWGSGEPNNLGGNENCMDINLHGQNKYLNDDSCTKNKVSICAKSI